MTDWLPAALILIGAAFVLIASIGVTRLPDVYTRMSATSKAATLGTACVLLAGAIRFVDEGGSARAIAAIAFIMLSAPVAAHMIARAACATGVALWEGTLRDELKGAPRGAERRPPGAPPPGSEPLRPADEDAGRTGRGTR